jgi:hypothetical protein
MAKVTVDTISSGFASNTLLNNNFVALQNAIENTLSRDGTTPNSMSAQLDMNSNRIINLATPTNGADATTKDYVDGLATITETLTATELNSLRLWDFDDSVTMADPGAGNFRLNNATIASATSVAISATNSDAGTPDLSDWIADWDSSTNTVKGTVYFTDIEDPANTAIFNITGTVTDNTDWLQFTIAYVDGAGSFTDEVKCHVAFSRAGDVGASGALSDTDYGDITVSGGGTVMTIDNGVIDAARLATDAVETAKILNDAVTTAKILDDNVTADKIDITGATDVTIAATDEILFSDADDSNNVRKDTVQGILDLATDQLITIGTPVATTSGTSVDITGIPSGTKRIMLTFNAVSTNGSSVPEIQIGDSGGIETTGYAGNGGYSTNVDTASSGFPVSDDWAAARLLYGTVILVNYDGDTWGISGTMSSTQPKVTATNGIKTLSGELTQVRLTTAGGSDTFDAGAINIIYE